MQSLDGADDGVIGQRAEPGDERGMSVGTAVIVVAVFLGVVCSLASTLGCGARSDGVDLSAPMDGGATDDLAPAAGGDLLLTADTTIAEARMAGVTTPITVEVAVTAVRGNDPVSTAEWYIEDLGGGPWSGINVLCDHSAAVDPCPARVSPPSLHEHLVVRGRIVSTDGKIRLLPTGTRTIHTVGGVQPPYAALPPDALVGAAMSPYRGVLITVTVDSLLVDDATPTIFYNAACAGLDGATSTDAAVSMPYCASCLPPTYGGFEVTDGLGHELFIENTFNLTEHLQSSPECSGQPGAVHVGIGTEFYRLDGILDWSPAAMAQTISPTSDGDYAIR